MGRRGPIGKRSSERMGHRSKAERAEVESVRVEGSVEAPDAREDWHEIAKYWFDSLKVSGQARFFEPSDWAAATYVAEAMSKNLEQGRFSAQLFASVWSAMDALLTTEGARRRVKLELHRGSGDEVPANVTALDEYRAALG